MASIAYTEGFYYVPRIDKSVIQDYKNDLIVLSGNLQGEIPQLILQVGENQAEESFYGGKVNLERTFIWRLIAMVLK